MTRCLVIGILVLICATPAPGQETPPCSYADCGLLRVDKGILAGQQREEIASFGFLSPPDLRLLFQASDSALHHLDIAEAHYRSGQILGLVGFLLAVGGAVAYEVIDEPGSSPSRGEWIALGVGLTGTGLAWWGDRRVTRARRAVDSGIWWYNGSLGRSP